MIDWITAKLPLTHKPLFGGCVTRFDRDGIVEWDCPTRIEVEGSYSSKITFVSHGSNGDGLASHISFSGNPSKFLQGHNVFGSDDAVSLMYEMYLYICKEFDLHPYLPEIKAVKEGNYKISRIDINYMYELNSIDEVAQWLKAAQFKSRARHGRPVLNSKTSTLYWQSTQRWIIKAYSKFIELNSKKKGHCLPPELENTLLKTWSENKVRLELVLQQKELQENNIDNLKIMNEKIQEIYNKYLGRIEMKGQIKLTPKEFKTLPRKLKSTYSLWLNGYDLEDRDVITKSTFYRHRAELLECGIDISIPPENAPNQSENIIPLIRILEAKPASIPLWAYENNLIHKSAA